MRALAYIGIGFRLTRFDHAMSLRCYPGLALPPILTLYTAVLGLLLPLLSWANPHNLALEIYTQEFPPLHFADSQGQLEGCLIEPIQTLVQRAQQRYPFTSHPIAIVPLKRALYLAQSHAHVLAFSIARTPEREDDFHWIGPLLTNQVAAYRLASRTDIQASELAQLLDKGLRIGSQSQSNIEEHLLSLGFGSQPHYSTIDNVDRNSRNIERLLAGHIDVLIFPELSLPSRLCELGIAADTLERIGPIPALSQPLWLLASLSTPAELVQVLRDELSRLTQAPEFMQDKQRQLQQWQQQRCLALPQQD